MSDEQTPGDLIVRICKALKRHPELKRISVYIEETHFHVLRVCCAIGGSRQIRCPQCDHEHRQFTEEETAKLQELDLYISPECTRIHINEPDLATYADQLEQEEGQ